MLPAWLPRPGLRRAHDTEDVLAPELGEVRLAIAAVQQFLSDVERLRRTVPAPHTAAAVEVA